MGGVGVPDSLPQGHAGDPDAPAGEFRRGRDPAYGTGRLGHDIALIVHAPASNPDGNPVAVHAPH